MSSQERLSDQMKMDNHHLVPLPSEVPLPPDISHLPPHILHSATVETLISQNEDLSARLKVNLRRNGILEQQIFEHERIASELARANSSLLSQMQVLQEKEKIWKDRTSVVDSKHDALREEIELLKARLEASEERKEELRAGLRFESTFRRRIGRWVRPLIKNLRRDLASELIRNKTLENQLSGRDAAISDLRARLSETFQRLQSIEKSRNKDQASLVDQYEARIKSMETELVRLRADTALSRDKAQRVDEAVSAKSEIENRLILIERQKQEVDRQVSTFRKEAKALAAESLQAQEQLALAVQERNSMSEQLIGLQDQFESLQAVWAETQKRMETMRLSQDSLNRLNQELSGQLKSERKKREEESAARSTSHGINSGGAIAAPLASQAPGARLERLDLLLAELESGLASGFSQMKKPEIDENNSL